MTNKEFYSRYREEFNLAAEIPDDILSAFGESMGITKMVGEMVSDYLDRISDHIEQTKQRVRKVDSATANRTGQRMLW